MVDVDAEEDEHNQEPPARTLTADVAVMKQRIIDAEDDLRTIEAERQIITLDMQPGSHAHSSSLDTLCRNVLDAAQPHPLLHRVKLEATTYFRRTTLRNGILIRPLHYARHFCLLIARFANEVCDRAEFWDSIPDYAVRNRTELAMTYTGASRQFISAAAVRDTGPQENNECA